MSVVIKLEQVKKVFPSPAGEFHAIRELDLSVEKGEFLGIMGHSGSGKSTLLNLVSGIDYPSQGRVVVNGQNLEALPEGALARFRGTSIGIVFQFFQLIPTLNVVENVMLAMDLVNTVPRKQRKQRAMGLLAEVGLEAHAGKLPSQLSGGEQQRVAIARALANDPPLLIADEPTGNLDSQNSAHIRKIFGDCAASGRTVLVATHEKGAMSDFSRIIQLEDGVLVGVNHD